jgi:branched-chain amino acid transport system permease protein
MIVRYEEELRLFRTRGQQVGIAALIVGFIAFPFVVKGDFWLSVVDYAGVAAIGAIGLNLLIGYTGQVSLGHAAFLGLGAYTAAYVGGQHNLPIFVWLPMAAALGGLVGAIVGPFALRLRGNYLAVISLGLVFLGQHLFQNWDSVTGGAGGTAVTSPVKVGPLDFNNLEIGSKTFTRNQGWFYLLWFFVGVVALLAKNIVRSRPGRAMQAVRDRDVAAEVIGVSLARYKVGAFAISSAMAALGGALFGAYQQFVEPGGWDIFLSIQYIAFIIVGGVGTIFGSVLGALFVGAVPQLVDRFSDSIPFVVQSASDEGLTVPELNGIIFGLLIVLFLVLEPRGLAAVWLRLKAYFKAWPFSY